MPSKNDFKSQAKMAYQTVQTSNQDGGFAIYAKNFYRRTVTIDNTGNSSKTNYLVAVIFDTFRMYVDFKITLNFNSLRVYDSDGTTPLDFYVQSAGSDQTVVFVKIPNIGNESKDIFFEYGNTGLPSLSNISILGDWHSRRPFGDWLMAHNARRRAFTKFNSAYNDFAFNNVQNWTNFKNTANWALFDSSDFGSRSVPLLNGHTGFGTDVKINNLDTVFFNGNSRMKLQNNVGSRQGFNNYNNSYFAIVLRTNSTTGNMRILGGEENGEISITQSGTSFSLVSRGETTFVSRSGVSNNTNYILEAWIRPTGGTGYSATMRVNGASNASNSSHSSFPSGLDSFRMVGGDLDNNFLNGYISEILYFNGLNTTSTQDTNDRNAVYDYLNTKYRIASSADMPTITVGSETTITNNITDNYVPYNSFSKFNSQSELKHGFFGAEDNSAQVEIKKIIDKHFISGQLNFTNTTLDLNHKISEKASREYTATTTSDYAVSDDFSLLNGADNLTSLDKFNYKDIVEGTDVLSGDFGYIGQLDYISFELNVEDASLISKTNSKLEFSDSQTFSNIIEINFSNIDLEDGLNTLMFKKSDFDYTVIFGLAKYCRVRIRTTVASQTVYFGNFRLVKNYDDVLKAGDKILLGQAVSLDQNQTFYKEVLNTNFTTEIFNNEKEISVKTQNLLNKFLNSRFDELPGWLNDGRQFFAGKESEPFEPDPLFVNKIVKRIFNLAFPYQFLDFQLEPEARMNLDENLFIARGEFKVGDYLEPLLNIYGSSVYFDRESQKLKLVTGFQKFELTSPSLESEIYIETSEILGFKESTAKEQDIFNSIEVSSYYIDPTITDNVYYGKYLPLSDLQQPIEIPPGTTQDVFINLENFDKTRGDFAIYLDNLTLTDAGLSETETGPITTNGESLSMKYTGLRFLAPSTIVFQARNNSFNTRWLRQVGFFGAFIVYYSAFPNSASNTDLTYKYQNRESIKKFGRKEFPIGNLRVSASTSADHPQVLKNFWENTIDNFSGLNNFKEVELEINNNPDIQLNTRVRFKNKEGLTQRGVVSKLEMTSTNKKTITVYIT